MKRMTICVICILTVVILVACGRRTAPVPFDIPENALPGIIVQQAAIKGNWMHIGWQIEKPPEDATADAFFIKVFNQADSCRYCRKKPIASLEVDTEDPGSGMPYFFRFTGNQNDLWLNESLHVEWEQQGLYYLTISYRTKSGLISKESEKISPTLTDPIVKPVVTIVKQTADKQSGSLDLILRWKQYVQRIYRTINNDSKGREIIQYYGMNFYQTDSTGDALFAENINDQPLLSGYARIVVTKAKFYASHVDRFGNESEKVLLLEHSPKKHKNMEAND